QLVFEIAAVIVEKAFRLVSPVWNLRVERAHLAIGRVPDLVDAGVHGLAPISLEQLAEAAHAKLAAGDLRAQVAECRLRKAQIIVDDLPERIVALAGVVDLQRAELQPLLIDLGGLDRAEANPHAADIDPVGTARGEGDNLAVVEAGRIDHHVVEVLAADEAMIHDDDVA